MIPTQLKNCRFNRVKFKEKKAFESGWQNKPYSYEEIQNYFPRENYGVMCGKELRVLDDDTPNNDLVKLFIENFGKTFQVRDHLYFKFDNGHSKKIIFYDQEKNHYGELQGENTYVVGAGSMHPSGEIYELKEDLPIETISYDKFLKVFKDYIPSNDLTIEKGEIEQDDEKIINEILPRWKEGDRQNLTLDLAGYLRKNKGFGYRRTRNIIQEICRRTGDNDFKERKKGIEETYFKDEAEIKGVSGLKERDVEIPNDNQEKIRGYIWDENKVIKSKGFPIDLHKDLFYYGLLLPKTIDQTDGKGKVYGKTQVTNPCLITSKGDILEVNERTKEDLNISFDNIPTYLPHRWKLEKIHDYLTGKSKKINGNELLKKISKQYKKYLAIMNEVWYDVYSVWDIGTYLYVIFEAYPLIENRGIAGSGKTKSMVVSSLISFNGGQIMVNPSESTLFRETEEIRGTKYFDEAEKLWVYNKSTRQYEGDVRTELINASYTKDAKVPRQEKIGNKFVTKWYSPYSPTQLSSINGLFGATEQRAITRITTKSPNDDPRGEKDPSEERYNPIWEEIRDECYIFALQNWKEIKKNYNEFPKDCGLKRRDLQIWKPLLSIMKFISETEYQKILNFAVRLCKRKIDDLIPESSFDYMCLNALKETIESTQSDKIYVNAIKVNYCALKNDDQGLKDMYLNRNISNHLDKLGFKEFRNRDMKASYFSIDESIFNEIVSPICPELVILSTSSTSSTSLHINNTKKHGDDMVIDGDKKNQDMVMMAINGENVDCKRDGDGKKDQCEGM